ncbi:T9SS C-terminal target domain-containing protein [Lutibacter sp. HS1-25]|uniref:Ig-like domain-containing protein n=1 Tax=Lutibacter sp. HS1-25 TaxID=2485000 RepID=UPI00101354BF|nr:Ig-like domain-containing protein [Lutibacter sp. HS1-25]RXP59366.1 T9SS C-terminal target domain-containing protein [Lutibacter sp. HS1-25]
MKIRLKHFFNSQGLWAFLFILFINSSHLYAQITLESEVEISNQVLFFDGTKVADLNNLPANSTSGYDYAYGNALTPHGDCIKTYKDFVFMTWYRGGKDDRHVMLTRYNTKTGVLKTIEFPHQHTGFDGNWWIGETHNTIAVGICPKDETVHLLYDMHRNGNVAAFANDYLRYSYTVDGAATVPDDEFTLDRFVNSPAGNFKHLAFDGIDDVNTTKLLTYPAFFTNDEGDLFMKMRFGYDRNGKFLFAKFDGTKWEGYTEFNKMQASSDPTVAFNWGLYGDFKYLNGKLRIGFQRRYGDRNDKYLYQNGIYYAYTDDPNGLTQWKDYKGVGFTRPIANADLIKIAEPGDFVATTQKDMVYIIGGFDFTVTARGDEHFVSTVKDNQFNVTKKLHTYRKATDADFTTEEYDAGSELYTSGDDVYVIGLKNGRVNIVKTEGGTNNFVEVYQQTTGPTFDKGVVYVDNGKLYYYLKQAGGTGDQRTTYLQIFDLGIVVTPEPFGVSLLTPQDSDVFSEGDDVSLYAKATTDNGSITKVEFLINDAVFAEDLTSPYSLNWTAAAKGFYTIKAIAYDDQGASISSSEITVEVKEVDLTDLSGDIYRLRNVATGQFLQAQAASATPVLMNNSGDGQDKEWSFVKTGTNFYNIDSELTGILRATGSSFLPPYAAVNTTKGSPATDSDKIWTVHYIAADNTYRFEAGSNGRFLYHDADGTVYNSAALDTDARSKWQVISKSVTLGVDDLDLNASFIKLYPNPAKNEFTIVFKGSENRTIIISDVLGKEVYKYTTNNESIRIDNEGQFKTGVYIVKVVGENQKSYVKKLIVN